ncbi:MAG: hypothetical protein EPN68_06455 [Rhodanobacter sp.]|nr:MAG: hypothetical protein EPN68_06455 [Rhodanobacter sp.]
MYRSQHCRQSVGAAAGTNPSCKRVTLLAKPADPLSRSKFIESHFQNGIDEFRFDCAQFTPDHQAISAVHLVLSTGDVKGNSKLPVHADLHSEVF